MSLGGDGSAALGALLGPSFIFAPLSAPAGVYRHSWFVRVYRIPIRAAGVFDESVMRLLGYKSGWFLHNDGSDRAVERLRGLAS